MHGLDILLPTVLLLGSGFIVILASRLARISPIVGFVIAGLALGPHGLGVIPHSDATHLLAELGVAFLLFDIGLHFSMKSAWSLRKDLFGLAPLQVLLCGLVLGFSMSFGFGLSADLALLCGLTLALSSTAVVMQLLADLNQSESPLGGSAKSILIFQDIAAIFLLIFADSSMGSPDALSMSVLITLSKTLLAFGIAIALGQFVLTPLLKTLMRYNDPEMFTVLSLLIVMVTSLATGSAGLSLTLGAFLAGMVLAETPFRVLLQTELRPFRSLLMALFFISIGMTLSPAAIASNIGTIAALAALIIATKGAIIGALVFVLKRPILRAIQLTFMLAQGSELALVIFSIATVKTALGPVMSETLIAAVTLSMVLTPFLGLMGYRWSLKVCSTMDNLICNENVSEDKKAANNRPVFIVSMGEVGKTIARALKAHDIPYIGMDHDRERFLQANAAGYIVTYGQSHDLRFWDTLGIKDARAMCVTSPRIQVARALAPVVKKIYPNLRRYAAVKDSADGVRYAALGMTPFHCHGAPPGVELACFLLEELGIDAQNIQNWRDNEQSAYLDSNKGTEDTNPVQTQAA